MEFCRADSGPLAKNIETRLRVDLKRELGRGIFHRLPSYNQTLYDFCTCYVDRYNGDNDSNPETNGEYLYLRETLSPLGQGTVFDVGANVGEWASWALLVNPAVRMHCFEPCEATFTELASKSWPPNVQLNHLGLGEVEGIMELHLVEDWSGMNSIHPRRGVEQAKSVKTESIHISTIDGYSETRGIKRIDLLKIDVEGHELAVFKGMQKMLTEDKDS
jgi:FkbM family methyltransferase